MLAVGPPFAVLAGDQLDLHLRDGRLLKIDRVDADVDRLRFRRELFGKHAPGKGLFDQLAEVGGDVLAAQRHTRRVGLRVHVQIKLMLVSYHDVHGEFSASFRRRPDVLPLPGRLKSSSDLEGVGTVGDQSRKTFAAPVPVVAPDD